MEVLNDFLYKMTSIHILENSLVFNFKFILK